MSKKAQVWTTDLMAAIILFIVVVVLYFAFSNSLEGIDDNDIDVLFKQASQISEDLMDSGTPANWDPGTVISLGLTNDDRRLNETKVQLFDGIPYEMSKLKLQISNDWIVFFEDKEGIILPISGDDAIGYPLATRDDLDKQVEYESLVTVRRLLIHNSEIVTMVVYVWR